MLNCYKNVSSPRLIFHFYVALQEQRCLEETSNEILTAIVHGMKREEPSDHVRLAATNALLNSLEFTKANFEKEVSPSVFLISGEFEIYAALKSSI